MIASPARLEPNLDRNHEKSFSNILDAGGCEAGLRIQKRLFNVKSGND
jgi:hypothetical protein